MRRLLLGFIIGLAAGAAVFWYLNAIQQASSERDRARARLANSAGKIRETVKFSEIRAEDIKEELARTGAVIREKAKKAGEAIADATANARTTTAIKTKLSKELGIGALGAISVDSTDGVVTLSGRVASHEEVAKAVRIALETEGVHRVISTLQVSPGK